MSKEDKTINLTWIRKEIRAAIKWYCIDEGMPKFWTTWNYKRSREATTNSKHVDVDFPYYTKSDMAIEEIAKRIYNKLIYRE